MENVGGILNTKCNPKHCTLEYQIKKEDSTVEMSRADLFKRFVREGEAVKDWVPVYELLRNVKTDGNAPQFTNWQAKYDAETAEKFEKVKEDMTASLIKGGVITKVLQTQYMLQLLMVNYLDHLKKAKLLLNTDGKVSDDIDLPKMSAIFTEMILTDRECESLDEIRKILVDWKNAQ